MESAKNTKLKELYTYVGEGGCHNNTEGAKQACKIDVNCEFVGQQSNGCWHKLKQDNNGASKQSTYTRGFFSVKEPGTTNNWRNAKTIYIVNHNSLPWSRHDALAKSLGGTVIPINSEQENTIATSLMKEYNIETAWTGAIRSGNKWVWSDSSPWEYTNWTEPLKELYTYVGEGGCHNNTNAVKNDCKNDANCQYIGQQSNSCWHKLKQDNNGASKKSTYTRGFFSVTDQQSTNGSGSNVKIINSGKWRDFNEHNAPAIYKIINPQYLVNQEKKTIRQHMETARKYGMELASIHSAHENEIIKQLLVLQNTKDNCWIGAKRKAGAFTWMDDSNWEFENWESGEPGASEIYVKIKSANGKWYDVNDVAEQAGPAVYKTSNRTEYYDRYKDMESDIVSKTEKTKGLKYRIEEEEYDLPDFNDNLIDTGVDADTFQIREGLKITEIDYENENERMKRIIDNNTQALNNGDVSGNYNNIKDAIDNASMNITRDNAEQDIEYIKYLKNKINLIDHETPILNKINNNRGNTHETTTRQINYDEQQIEGLRKLNQYFLFWIYLVLWIILGGVLFRYSNYRIPRILIILAIFGLFPFVIYPIEYYVLGLIMYVYQYLSRNTYSDY